MSEKVIAFGPEKNVPSWNWVGWDTSRELSKYYKVVTFSKPEKIPACNICVFIKEPPSERVAIEARRRGVKLVYAPIDFYISVDQVRRHSNLFRNCDLILSHCERLNRLITPYNKNVHFIEHNNKYALPEMADYKENGFVLWVGGCQYVAYLLQWLKDHPIRLPVKILTDLDNGRARQAAKILAYELGFNLTLAHDASSTHGCEVHQWSERLQFEMMTDCKAAIDIKGTDKFNQHHKPPTKAQKYIASGIPFAINKNSYPYEYFFNRGFDLAQPTQTARWFSKEYWEETRKHGEKLRSETSIETVGSRYREFFDKL